MPSKHGVFSLISSPYPVYCRSGGSMTWTAAATYRPRSSRWSELRFSKPVQLKDKPSVGSRSQISLAHWHMCPLAASPTLLTVKPNSSMKIHLNINVTSYCSFLSFVYCLAFFCFFFQAFLGDLFQQHHKDVSADKLEEYTDTMVTLDFIIMLDL